MADERFSLNNLPLQNKLGLIILTGLLAAAGLFSYLSIQSVNDNTRRILDQRLDTARILAAAVDENMMHTLAHLQNAARGDSVPDTAEFAALTKPLLQTLISTGISVRSIILTDKSGLVILTNPENTALSKIDVSQLPEVKRTLDTGKAGISNQITLTEPAGRTVLAIVPFLNQENEILGLMAAAIDPMQSNIRIIEQLAQSGNTEYVEIIDGNGIVLARTDPGTPPSPFEKSDHPGHSSDLIRENRAVVRTCHRCHEEEQGVPKRKDIMAFAPLSSATWGIGIRQAETEALAPARELAFRFLALGAALLLGAAPLVSFVTRGIVRPLKTLEASARKVASGDFSTATPSERKDEIGQLNQSFYKMTQELAKSREQLIARNTELSSLNEARGQFLSGTIAAQEEERRRISRELHDESGQNLTAAIMKLESVENLPQAREAPLKTVIAEVKTLMSRTLEELRRLTHDLRPTALDDLGLPSAIRTYARNRLETAGVHLEFESKGFSKSYRLSPLVETAVFRMAQEAVNNIIKHSEAKAAKVHISIESDMIRLIIEDNGKSFDTGTALAAKGDRQPLGLLGIKERTAILGGAFSITTEPGKGTRLDIQIPAVYAQTEPKTA